MLGGINRYMVECEYAKQLATNKGLSVLIDTWWNVNQFLIQFQKGQFHVLIDTWWNVNYYHLAFPTGCFEF